MLSARPRILLIQLEFATWARARAWSYCAQLGFEEGLAANGADFVTVLALYDFTPEERERWYAHVRELCSATPFDQIWLEAVHAPLADDFLDFLATVAPVRLAIIGESLEYAPEAYDALPGLRERRALVEKKLRRMTHALVVDERDQERLSAEGLVRAMWWQSAVPGRFICSDPAPPALDAATFFGSLYGERQGWLSMESLKGSLVRGDSGVDATRYPALFDEVQEVYRHLLRCGRVSEELTGDYLDAVRALRRRIFEIFLDDFRMGCAVVNLPHFVQAYPGRVVETMAAGRPMITCDVPDRPRTGALFREGEEILVFTRNNPAQLASHISRLRSDPDFAKRMAARARETVTRRHTTELLVAQMLDFVAGAGGVAACEGVASGDQGRQPGLMDERELGRSVQKLQGHLRSLGLWGRAAFAISALRRKLR